MLLKQIRNIVEINTISYDISDGLNSTFAYNHPIIVYY